MAYQFKLPDIGEGIAEGEIVKWFVKAGDTINEDDTLLEVQNDKSVEEIPSPVTGTVKNVLVPEGTVANVGDVLVEIDAPGHEDNEESGGDAGVAAKEQTPEQPAAEPTAEVTETQRDGWWRVLNSSCLISVKVSQKVKSSNGLLKQEIRSMKTILY